MKLEYSFPKELEKARAERWPFVIPLGVIEYHGKHVACGCDTFLTVKPIEMLEKERDIVVAPPFWYGPSSWAVAGPEKPCSINVGYDALEKLFEGIFSSLLGGGWRNIYVLYFHQCEDLNPMALSVMKGARVALFNHLEGMLGKGWWGDEKNQSFYEGLSEGDKENPWNWIHVVPITCAELIAKYGFDHAGKYETSFLNHMQPDAVRLDRRQDNDEWFAKASFEANDALGTAMTEDIMARLRKLIV